LQWIVANPKKGVCVPDDLPYDEIIREALPFLGPFISTPVDWTPLDAAKRELAMEYRNEVVTGVEAKVADEAEQWQFTSFLVQ